MNAGQAERWLSRRQRTQGAMGPAGPQATGAQPWYSPNPHLNPMFRTFQATATNNKVGPQGPRLPAGPYGHPYSGVPTWGRAVNPNYADMLEGIRNRRVPSYTLSNSGVPTHPSDQLSAWDDNSFDPNFRVWNYSVSGDGQVGGAWAAPDAARGPGARYSDPHFPQMMAAYRQMLDQRYGR